MFFLFGGHAILHLTKIALYIFLAMLYNDGAGQQLRKGRANMRYRFLRFPGGRDRAVTFSYDDGCPEDVRLTDIFGQYGMKGTFNLNGDCLRRENFTAEEIDRYYLSRGHEIAVHGLMHRAPGCLRPLEAIRDILDCRLELERKTGTIIRGMAYPDSGIHRFENGTDYEQIKQYLRELDIVYARTTWEDNCHFELPQDWYCWKPTAHHNNPDLMDHMDQFFKHGKSERLYGCNRGARLFYLWGHSYEFPRNNNWDRIERVCEAFAGHDDVWRATNGEIYDYVQAYNSLVYSADGTLVYNPTLHEVWFELDEVTYSVKPGEKIKTKA